MNKNDNKVLQLKEQIRIKKEKIVSLRKFTPITNMILDVDSKKHNINTMNLEKSMEMVILLNAKFISAKELGLEDVYTVNGYKLYDWICDLKSRIDYLNVRQEENNLEQMEAKLDRLLSEEKKTELELDKIENLLK